MASSSISPTPAPAPKPKPPPSSQPPPQPPSSPAAPTTSSSTYPCRNHHNHHCCNPPPPPTTTTPTSRKQKSPSAFFQPATATHRILTISLLIGVLCWPTQIHCVDPKFDPSTRMRLVLVPADAQVGSVIYRLRATDEEFDYPLTFELVGDASASTVKIESLPCTKYNSVCQANVILQRRLEPGRYYDFQVSVKDTKGGMTTQRCSITATNFTTPHDLIFPHKPGIIMIPEDAKRGTELDYVISRKNPHFPKPVYLELWGSPLFAIRQKIVSTDTTEGTIFLLGPLDFEKQAMYHLTILANDAYAESGQDSRNIAGLEVVVIVQDVQDQPPVFTMAPPVTKLPPGILPGDKILQVHAEDGDKGNPREVRYGLVSEGNPFTSFFDINDTSGEIFLMRPLEDIAAITHVGDPVLLTVVAEEVKVGRDEPPAAATTVQLAFFLPERSNSPPYFEIDHYVSRVDENAPQGTALTFVDPYVPRVYDDDTGKNGVFSLTLLNNNGTFEISPNVAERSASFLIRVRDNMLLDYEERHSVEFQVLAQELGPATNLSAIVNVTVYINDVNDNPPVFTQTVYTVELPENMTVGTKVVQVHADDVDTGMGGRVRYTAILGYLNTSLNLDAENGIITVSTNSHGFDREIMPEYHLYVEARDSDGTGNRAQVPLVIKMIDVNDETPTFEKNVYEFILAADLQSFTSPAYIKAVDKDATAPNNEVRYEIINGNYDNKFSLNKVTGELTVQEKIFMRSKKEAVRSRRQVTQSPLENDMFVLTARAYDLGVPVRFSTATIRIYPPESRTRTVTFVVPGFNPDKQKTAETLSTITGGRVIIHDIRPMQADEPGAKNLKGDIKERSVVTATVLYEGASVVDISQIQQRLSQHNGSYAIMTKEEMDSDALYKAENKLLFWLLILLATLVALTILILLLCCICSWCPLYGAASKRIVNISRTEDDVHLVHREIANGKQSKSVQVAEWMGRREAWSAEKSSDTRTKPTRWEFHNGHGEQPDESLGRPGRAADTEAEHLEERQNRRIKSAEDQQRRVRIKNTQTAKDDTHLSSFHNNSRTNLVNNEREVYIEDIIDEEQDIGTQSFRNRNRQRRTAQQQIDDDSMRRHEIDRGSDMEYNGGARGSLKAKREYFIKDGNVEILQLMTRDKQGDEEDNIYVNLPLKATTNLSHPQLLMVDQSGKEILMRRFIEEQPDGKQIIREHYQIVPGGANYIQTMPNEVQHSTYKDTFPSGKSGPNSIVYSQAEPEVKIIHTQPMHEGLAVGEVSTQMQPAISNQSLTQELENSLKQQNALLRQILMEKEKVELQYSQQDVALETQSLPGQPMAIATQTDCEAGTQTEADMIVSSSSVKRQRRARSENDDSFSEDEYEYVRFSPPNSPEGVYWIKRKRQKKRSKQRPGTQSRKRVVMVEDVKRKIRTPIKEEDDDDYYEYRKRSPPKKPIRYHGETKASLLRRMKSEENRKLASKKSASLNREVLMEISDSLDEKGSPDERVRIEQMEYYENSEEDSDADEIVIKSNALPSTGHKTESSHFEIHVSDGSNNKVYSRSSSEQRNHIEDRRVKSPDPKPRLSRKDNVIQRNSQRRSQTASEPPHSRVVVSKGTKVTSSDVRSSKRIKERDFQSDTNLLDHDDAIDDQSSSKGASVPKYMDWYYSKKKSDVKPAKSKSSTKKLIGGSEKRITKIRLPKSDDSHPPTTTSTTPVPPSDEKYKPEPAPRKSPPKGARLLKEDVMMNKNHKPKIETDTNHPLLQHSEHRYEHEYDNTSELPLAPTKLPHYMYPETPPQPKGHAKSKDLRPKPSPIKENEIKVTNSKIYIQDASAQSKQLNVATLEDDHDSGIAMNSLLNSMGRRNPIAEKKSVFSIAYDDVSRVQKIQSGSDSPQYS
ncbi:cadherin-86C [Eupeodes corollae]|uniref:cadherin-86C n=1 Tax=Eupeodes corollae TaxID=290404 RepID=UPI00249138BB|nr:cadherin-86C [Eupeodes corollae]XP_055908353.1 cadherin-86C [Eupeodes corollae]XP_055908354.1 cadherin-86C [Eupeodes corollae]